MRKILFLFLCLSCVLTSSIVSAGGYPLHVKIDQFEDMGNDEFKVIFLHVDEKLPNWIEKDKPIIFYLSNAFSSKKEAYQKNINILKNHYQNGDEFYFSTAINETIPGKVNEFQSNWLFLGKGIDRSKMDTVTAAQLSETQFGISFGAPSNYPECIEVDKQYKEESDLRCIYSVSTDKANNDETKKYIECLSKLPDFKDLSFLNCEYIANEGNKVVPKILQCKKSDGNNYYPGIVDDEPCKLILYNPNYIFPKNFEECKKKKGDMSRTYLGEEICSIEIKASIYGGRLTTFIYNQDTAKHLIDSCIALGGHFEKALGKHPQCRLIFVDEVKP